MGHLYRHRQVKLPSVTRFRDGLDRQKDDPHEGKIENFTEPNVNAVDIAFRLDKRQIPHHPKVERVTTLPNEV